MERARKIHWFFDHLKIEQPFEDFFHNKDRISLSKFGEIETSIQLQRDRNVSIFLPSYCDFVLKSELNMEQYSVEQFRLLVGLNLIGPSVVRLNPNLHLVVFVLELE